jgi:hypothetical protein
MIDDSSNTVFMGGGSWGVGAWFRGAMLGSKPQNLRQRLIFWQTVACPALRNLLK